MSGAGQCTNAFFGSDPAPGVTKTCELSSTAAPAPAPAPVVGSATLAWAAPQANADGTALTDLAGFRVYYGTARGTYTQSVTISSPTTLRYTIQNLSAGTYYMVVKAFDTSNIESAASTEVSKTIQ